jgi:hypothetical protein
MSKLLFGQVLDKLTATKRSIRCDELAEQLVLLGFEVRDGKQGGHKIYVHDGLTEFKSASYNCGHGRNPEIKPAYISNVLRILRQHEAEIVDYLEKRNED